MFSKKELEILKDCRIDSFFRFVQQTLLFKKIILKHYVLLKSQGYSERTSMFKISSEIHIKLGCNPHLSDDLCEGFNNYIFNLSQNKYYTKFLQMDLEYFPSIKIQKKIIKPFPFLDKNTYLIAELIILGDNINCGTKNELIFVKYNNDFSKVLYLSSINCIHTAINTFSVGEMLEKMGKEIRVDTFKDLEQKTMSSENFGVLQLSPGESFKALCSYVQGIAEAGYGAFFLSKELGDNIAGSSFVIGERLFEMILQSHTTYEQKAEVVLEYLEYCNRVCRFENELHESSMIANLKFLKRCIRGLHFTKELRKLVKEFATEIGVTF